MDEKIVYLNGAFVPESEAKVSVLDAGFNAGDGVYDVTRTFAHQAFSAARSHRAAVPIAALHAHRLRPVVRTDGAGDDRCARTQQTDAGQGRRGGDLAGGEPRRALVARQSWARQGDGGDLLHFHRFRRIRAGLSRRG